MAEAVIISTARTPIGKAYRGAFNNTQPQELVGHVIKEAVARATSTLRGVEGAWIKDQNILIEDGNITGYKVNLEVTFVLEP